MKRIMNANIETKFGPDESDFGSVIFQQRYSGMLFKCLQQQIPAALEKIGLSEDTEIVRLVLEDIGRAIPVPVKSIFTD